MNKGKIGIFLPGAHGDVASSTSILKYKDILWPDKDIVWFSRLPQSDILKYNDAIFEIRHWPEGYGLPERCKTDGPLAVAAGLPMWEDFSILKTSNNRLDQNHKFDYESTKDLEDGFFPGPWQIAARSDALIYADCPKIVFGIDLSWEWHPFLGFSDEEREQIKEFHNQLPYKKTIIIENIMLSGDVHWSKDMTKFVIEMCKSKLGECNIILASINNDNIDFINNFDIVSCSNFTVRQTALLVNYSDLFIGVNSGISVVSCCWGNKAIPRIEWCGSPIISLKSMVNGPIETVFTDYRPIHDTQEELKVKLSSLLDAIK